MGQTTLTGRLILGALYASIAVAILATAVFVVSSGGTIMQVTVAGEKLSVMIADTPELQERGLSGHKSLGGNEGMLFVFPAPVKTGFWMKDMLFPIDIVWFDANRHIVDVWGNASPSSYPEIRTPHSEASYVLEVQSGFFKKHNLKFGDVLELESVPGYTNQEPIPIGPP